MPRNLKPSLAGISLSLLIFFIASSYSFGQGLIPAASLQKSPSTNQGATGQSAPQTTQERRAQAYAKIMEGERFLLSLRGNPTDVATRAAAQSAFQEAARLEPTIAETHTALAEIALFQPQDLELALREATAATRIDHNNFGAHKLLSRIYALKSGLRENNLERNAAEQAIAELREVVRLDSNDAEAWGLLGELYQKLGKTTDAIEAFSRWAEAPEPVDARIFQVITGRENSPAAASARLGEVLLEAGRAADAVNAIRSAITLDPENEEYAELLGQALEAEGIDDSAAITELQSLAAASPKNFTLLRLLASEQSRAGQTDAAAQTLRTAITAAADNPEQQTLLRVALAELYADALRYTDAVAAYEALLQERGITNKPLTTDAEKRYATVILSSIVSLQKNAGHMDDALATIERMRTLLGADSAAADVQYIQLLRDEGRRREALQAIKLARQHHAEERGFIWLEAETLTDLGRVDEAVALARGQLHGSIEDFETYLRLSSLYTQARRGREAVESARKAIELVPQGRDDLMIAALVTLASAEERAGDSRSAEETLKRVLGMDPNDATALNNMGYFLIERNERLEEALKMIQRAVRAEPANSSFLDSLGWAYFKLGKLDEAERHLTEAARRAATSPTIQEHLGDILERRGKMDQARAAWQKALTLATDSEDITRIKTKLNARPRTRD